jgi:hypothetical protein
MKPVLTTTLTTTLAAALAIAFADTAAAQRMDAQIDCRPTGEAYVHHCMIRLFEMPGGNPVEDASFVVHADMPSMPMAHSVPPARAVPGDGAGVYEAMLEFEMHGVWALRLDVSAPRRDVVLFVVDLVDDEHKHGHTNEHGHDHGHGHDTQ